MLAQGLDNQNTFIFKTQTPYFAISEYMDFHTENSDTSIFLRFMNSLTWTWHNMSRTLQIRRSKLLQLRSSPFLFTLCDHLKWLPSLIASELFHFIEQWSDYYEDDGEEAALMHDTYKYYFPENYNDEDYGYVPSCTYLKHFKNNEYMYRMTLNLQRMFFQS